MLKIKNKKLKLNKGMTLFIAVVIMGILLFISFAAINVALKGTLFATSGRDSQFAFYAADAGIECAEYWDSKFDPSKFDISVGGSPINCGGYGISTGQNFFGTTVRIGGPEADAANDTSIFGFVMNRGNNPVLYCAIVTVEKRQSDGKTYIKSKGYNTCDTSNPRRVERGIEVTY